MNVDSIAPGSFCWSDLATPDAAGAKAFYKGLFGWETTDSPMGEGMVYTMLSKGGRNVGALYQNLQAGNPSALGSLCGGRKRRRYHCKREGSGCYYYYGAIRRHGAWSNGGSPGPYRSGALRLAGQAPSRIRRSQRGWSLLLGRAEHARDRESRRVLPAALQLGGEVRVQFGTGTYTEFQSGEKSVAGMMEIQPEWGDVPPHWMVYYQVENCDASVSKAQELGAQVLVPGTDIPGVGQFSVLRDPQGAVLGIVD